MLRPLFVTNSFAHGGAERHAITLMNRLAERGHECHAAFIKQDQDQLRRITVPPASRVRCLDARRYFDAAAVKRLVAMIGETEPSVIIAANEYSLLYATIARRCAKSRAPIVVTYHSTLLTGLKEHLKMMFYRFLFWRAHCAVFVCDNQRRFWRRRGVLSRRNEVIFNGVDTREFRPARKDAIPELTRGSLGLGESDFVIGITAGLRPEKNHLQLVEAVKRLRDRNIPARALLIGDGRTRGAIEAHAQALGVSAHIIITGFQSDVRPYLNLCDAAVLCSTSETFSLAAIEAMALGKPFVHSNIGGASEMIYPGWNGFLFPAGNTDAFVARLTALADGARARIMGANARLVVESRFSEERMVDRYERLLQELCGAGSRLRLSAHPR